MVTEQGGLRNWRRLAVMVIVGGVFFVPTVSEAQCNVTNTMVYNSSAPATILIVKTLSAPTYCSVASSMANNCYPAAASVTQLSASRVGSSPSPFCSWTCGCGPVTIDTSDGLPVELMDFELESGDSSESDERDGESGEDRESR